MLSDAYFSKPYCFLMRIFSLKAMQFVPHFPSIFRSSGVPSHTLREYGEGLRCEL